MGGRGDLSDGEEVLGCECARVYGEFLYVCLCVQGGCQ